jgi:hypothetical protein
MAQNTIKTVGDFTAILSHPLVLAGVQIPLKGFKFSDIIVSAIPSTASAKRVLLANGDTLALTNAVKAGTLTFNCAHVSEAILDGDLPSIAWGLQGLADNIGGIIYITHGMNGGTSTKAYFDCRLVSCPAQMLAGSDVATYTVVFTYGTFISY